MIESLIETLTAARSEVLKAGLSMLSPNPEMHFKQDLHQIVLCYDALACPSSMQQYRVVTIRPFGYIQLLPYSQSLSSSCLPIRNAEQYRVVTMRPFGYILVSIPDLTTQSTIRPLGCMFMGIVDNYSQYITCFATVSYAYH
ncbi:hypothetical protein ACH5RR_031511 [Cinchona calisaya]|uniref:Uncharacterized protein n=1 Tax=Cinchona calisaya TaxID=153742 RepID=A0ABD2YFG5_9GENT